MNTDKLVHLLTPTDEPAAMVKVPLLFYHLRQKDLYCTLDRVIAELKQHDDVVARYVRKMFSTKTPLQNVTFAHDYYLKNCDNKIYCVVFSSINKLYSVLQILHQHYNSFDGTIHYNE